MRQARVPLPGTCQASGTRGRATLVRSIAAKITSERAVSRRIKVKLVKKPNYNPLSQQKSARPPYSRVCAARRARAAQRRVRSRRDPHLSARIRERDRRSSQKRRSYDSALEQSHGMRAASLGVHGPPRASSPADSSVLHGEDLLLPRGHQPANLILVLLYCLLYVVLVVLDQILADGLLHLLDLVQRALADVAQRHLAVLP